MQFGAWQVDWFRSGRFRLDGGAMFGTVPKVVWSRHLPADSENRIPLTTNCLLGVGSFEGRRRVVLVETGCGWKGDATFRERLALEDAEALLRELSERGLSPGDVTDVVLTHLHLDHAGGATYRDGRGRLAPTFPKARHWVQAKELEDALNPAPRARASYLQDDFAPLLEAGLLCTVDGEAEVLPGLILRPLPGHNRGHQGVIFKGEGRRILYPGDLVPTRHHLHPTWAMAYDLDVNTCVEMRLRLLEESCGVEDFWVLDHEIDHPLGRVQKDSKGRFVWISVEA